MIQSGVALPERAACKKNKIVSNQLCHRTKQEITGLVQRRERAVLSARTRGNIYSLSPLSLSLSTYGT